MKTNLDILEISEEHRPLIKAYIAEKWGSSISVSRGRIFNTEELPGFICLKENQIIGLITYFIDPDGCEIVTLNSEQEGLGLATSFIDKVVGKARENGSPRVWLITTNDNTHAIRYYQRRGFEWVAFYKDSMAESRKIKPEIAEIGFNDIPMKHEIEFEMIL